MDSVAGNSVGYICYDLYFTWTGTFTCESHLYLLSTAWKTTTDTISAHQTLVNLLPLSGSEKHISDALMCPCPIKHALDKSKLHAVVYISMFSVA